MALNYRGTNIPADGNVKRNTTECTKVNRNSTTVWEKKTSTPYTVTFKESDWSVIYKYASQGKFSVSSGLIYVESSGVPGDGTTAYTQYWIAATFPTQGCKKCVVSVSYCLGCGNVVVGGVYARTQARDGLDLLAGFSGDLTFDVSGKTSVQIQLHASDYGNRDSGGYIQVTKIRFTD